MDLDFFAPTGAMIQEYLDLNKMSEAELADKLGLTESFMSKVMSGVMPLSDDMADEIAKIFGIDAAYFKDYEKSYREFLNKNK